MGDKNNTNQPTTQDEIPENYDLEAMSPDSKVVYQEVLELARARQSIENGTSIQKLMDDKQNIYDQAKANKMKLEKAISETKCQLEQQRFQNEALRSDIKEIRGISKKIRDYAEWNDRTLKQCLENTKFTTETNKKLKQKIDENLVNLDKTWDNKQKAEVTGIATIESEREKYKQNLMRRENECLETATRLKAAKDELECLKNRVEEKTFGYKDLITKIDKAKNDEKQLENIQKDKQNSLENLAKEMSIEEEGFEQRTNEVNNSLEAIRDELQNNETEITTLERATKSQSEYSTKLMGNMTTKQEQIEALRLQNDQLSTSTNEKMIKYREDEKQLRSELSLKLEEVANVKTTISTDLQALHETQEAMAEEIKKNKRNELEIKELENMILSLQNKQDIQRQHIISVEKNNMFTSCKIEELKDEIHELQIKTEDFERKTINLISNKSDLLKAAIANIKQLQEEEQHTQKSVVEGMRTIKINFDIKTDQQIKEIEEKRKPLLDDLEKKKIELKQAKYLQVSLNDELETLNIECNGITEEIAGLVKEMSKKRAVVKPQSQPLQFSQSSFFPPQGRANSRAFDELSGSSAEGTVITYQQVQILKREKERRRQARELQKMQSKAGTSTRGKTSRK